MDDTLRATLIESGIDMESAMERFMGNEAMFQKFLVKFLSDTNMELLRNSLEAGDADTAFRAAHTLKGVCGNLSLVSLARAASEITEYLRSGDMESAVVKLPEVEAEYEKTIGVIKKYF